jgi:hypothetical protein
MQPRVNVVRSPMLSRFLGRLVQSSTSAVGAVQSFEASANWPGAPAAIIGTLGYQALRARWS